MTGVKTDDPKTNGCPPSSGPLRVEGDKIALVSMVTPDLVERFSAGKIVGEVAKQVGGKGGGRADMAQGGGTQPQNLDAALARVFELVGG